MRQENQQPLQDGGLERLVENIYLAIGDERRDAAYYRALAEAAPSQLAAEMITEFAEDEQRHAYQLRRAYERLTGRTYSPEQEEYEFNFTEEEYQEALESRIPEETEAYKRYKNYYLMTNNQYLRDIFFNALNDEAQHSIRGLYLLHMAGMGMMTP
jgi:rubrerythrin